MASRTIDHDRPCPVCSLPIGDHTFRSWEVCLTARHGDLQEAPDDPHNVQWLDGFDGPVVDEVRFKGGYYRTDVGIFPTIRFQFVGPGPGLEPGDRYEHTPTWLVLPPDTMKGVRRLFSNAVDTTILMARRAK